MSIRGETTDNVGRSPAAPRLGKTFTFSSAQRWVDLSAAYGAYVDIRLITDDADGVTLLALDTNDASGANAIATAKAASTTSGATLEDKRGACTLSSMHPLLRFVPTADTRFLHGLRAGSADITVEIVVS